MTQFRVHYEIPGKGSATQAITADTPEHAAKLVRMQAPAAIVHKIKRVKG